MGYALYWRAADYGIKRRWFSTLAEAEALAGRLAQTAARDIRIVASWVR